MRIALLASGLLSACVAVAGLAPAIATGAPPARVLELVSSSPKTVPVVAADISRDGNRAVFRLQGGNDQTTFGRAGSLLAERMPSGWVVASAMPPREQFGALEDAVVMDYSSDLTRLALIGRRFVGALGPGRVMSYVPGSGAFVNGGFVSYPNSADLFEILASDDLQHVMVLLNGDRQVFEMLGAQPQPVSVMNDGRPGCSVRWANHVRSLKTNNEMSSDGNRIVFVANDSDCSTVSRVYIREGGVTGRTITVSDAIVSGIEQDATFVQASADGRRVVFVTASRLDLRDRNDSVDVYRYVSGQGSSCMTCVVPDANVDVTTLPTVLASEDAERGYFASASALAPGAIEGESNLYLWDARGVVRFVAPVNTIITAGTGANAIATGDASTVVFESSRVELNELTGTDNGGFEQLYRYDAGSDVLNCVSCPPGQATTSVDGLGLAGVRTMDALSTLADNGRSVFFLTAERLVRDDVNATGDIYEWRDGDVALVTDGLTNTTYFLHAASADGRDVLFTAAAKLTPDARDEAKQLYDARVGGGFPSPPPAPVPCTESVCQGQPGTPPALPSAGTVTFNGPASEDEADDEAVVGKVRLGRRSVRGPRITLTVRAPAAGRIVVRGARTTTASRAVARAGTYKLVVRLTRRARAVLQGRGRMRARLRVTYRPRAGASSSAQLTVTVKAS